MYKSDTFRDAAWMCSAPMFFLLKVMVCFRKCASYACPLYSLGREVGAGPRCSVHSWWVYRIADAMLAMPVLIMVTGW